MTLNAPASHALALLPSPPRPQRRTVWVSAAVLLAHGLAGWLMAQGWMAQPPQLEAAQVIMASVTVEASTALTPATTPPPKARPQAAVQPEAKLTPQPKTPTAPLPVANTSAPASAASAQSAPVASAAPATSASSAIAAASAPNPSVGKPAPPSVVLPSSDADYLNNPPPAYPRMSKRLGEQGTVIVRVFIGLQGTAEQAEIRTSSGYDRLDKAALETVQRWRYVPGKRLGSPEAMWFNVPVRFVLE